MNPRIRKVYENLGREGLDCLIVFSSANITYLTKYTSRDSFLLVSEKENIYFTDSRYLEEARDNLRGIAKVCKINDSLPKLLVEAACCFGFKRLGFEERHTSFFQYKKLKQEVPISAELVPTLDLIEKIRQVKEAQEVEKIKQAVKITASALKFIEGFILSGKREIEIAGEIERFIRYNGASKCSFDTIVASGPNSSFPHHISSTRKLRDNEVVLIDIGVDYMGYKSDLTRIFFLGKIKILTRKIYDIVLKAQELALRKIRPGVSTRTIDAYSRQYITKAGYGACFGHNLGHGVGLQVHEGPSISVKDGELLLPGMVFTVEPAIYLAHKFGIRIEDMVLVTKKGCEVLSGAVHK